MMNVYRGNVTLDPTGAAPSAAARFRWSAYLFFAASSSASSASMSTGAAPTA
jgi:hypothetical protein